MQQPNDNSRSTPRYQIEIIDRSAISFARAINTPLEQSNMNMDMPSEKKEQRKRRKSPKSSTKASSEADADRDTDRDTVRVPRSVLKEIIARAKHLSSVLEDMLESSEQKKE